MEVRRCDDMKDKELKVEDVEAPHTLGGAWSWSCKSGTLVEGFQILKYKVYLVFLFSEVSHVHTYCTGFP